MYLHTMMMLIINEIDDHKTQDKIDLARVECGTDQRLQHQLDVRQRALNEARTRNRQKIRDIALMN